VLLPVAAALAVLACQPASGRRLVIAVPAGPATIAPNALNEEFTLSVLSNVYETVVDLDGGLGLRPGLAESWHTPDDLTWVFRIRTGVRTHDGGTLRAQDVAQSLEHARSAPESRRRVQLAILDRIETPDDHTLVLTTRTPFDPLPTRLSNIHIWRKAKDGSPVGTGPYRVRSWSSGGDAVLEAFPSYRQGKPAIDAVEFRVMIDPLEREAAVRAGTAQLAIDVPAEHMQSLDKTPGVRSLAENGLRVLLLGMDTVHAFRDVRVRRAVALAIDRRALVSGPLGGFAEVVDQIASPQEMGQAPDLPERRYDPQESLRLLAAAGHPQGLDVDLEYMPQKYRAMEAVASAIAADLLQVGIRVTPRPRAGPELLGRIERHETALYILGWISDSGDGRLSYEYLLHSPGPTYGLDNGGAYSNPEVDSLIERASSRLSVGERREILDRLARIVYDEVPVVPLYRQANLYAVSRSLVYRPRLDRRMRAFEMAWVTGS
jgi:peptide/nickel transport system substrate-binding protein